jgi:hypothetical protein
MRTLSLPLLTLTLTSMLGCASARPDLLPEMGVAHQIAEPVTVQILVAEPDRPGAYRRKAVTYPAGAWIRWRTDTPLPATATKANAGDSRQARP